VVRRVPSTTPMHRIHGTEERIAKVQQSAAIRVRLPLTTGVRSKPEEFFRMEKKEGAIEGPIRIPARSLLFLFNVFEFPIVSAKSLKFHPVLFSISAAHLSKINRGYRCSTLQRCVKPL
jgi:hypothetical protein